MTRIWLSLCAVGALAACGPTVPTAKGVGFGNYQDYAYSTPRARQAQLETPVKLPPQNTGAPAPTNTGRGLTAAELAAAGIDTSSTLRVRQQGTGRVLHEPPAAANGQPAPATAPPRTVDPVTPGADLSPTTVARAEGVPGVEPVQAAPLSALRPGAISDQTYAASNSSPVRQVTAPAANRPSSTGPDVVQFALSTSHAVGTKIYRRTFASEAKARRACARFTGQDLAQRAFLEAGGPQRDRLGLDPDGDGFACAWSPEPFRAARG